MKKIFSKGIFILSLDTEFAWGTDTKKIPKKECQFKKNREMIEQILELLQKYQISVTWAIVGKLFLKDGQKENSIWDARDIVERIRDFPVAQEIASHSFSHCDFTRLSKQKAYEDLEKCKRVAQDLGIDLRTFVFPYNKAAHLELLSQEGFLSYRGQDAAWYKKINLLPTFFKLALNVLEEILVITPEVVVPQKEEENPLMIPGSMPYLSKDSVLRFIPTKNRVLRAKKGIDKAINEKKIFHLWFHPFNLASEPQSLLQGLEEILSYAFQKRKAGALEILSMKEVCKIFVNYGRT